MPDVRRFDHRSAVSALVEPSKPRRRAGPTYWLGTSARCQADWRSVWWKATGSQPKSSVMVGCRSRLLPGQHRRGLIPRRSPRTSVQGPRIRATVPMTEPTAANIGRLAGRMSTRPCKGNPRRELQSVPRAGSRRRPARPVGWTSREWDVERDAGCRVSEWRDSSGLRGVVIGCV